MSQGIPPHYNIAAGQGIQSTAAAGVFVALYIPTFAFYLWKAIQKPTYVPIISTVFAIIRIITFILRAVFTTGTNGESLVLFITYSVFFGTGFISLLFITFSYLDGAIARYPDYFSRGVIERSGRVYGVIRVFLIAVIALGIAASTFTMKTDPESVELGTKLNLAAAWCLQIGAVAGLLGTLVVAVSVRHIKANGMAKSFAILIISSLLIVIRCSFNLSNRYISPQPGTNETLWYIFSALTEYLAFVILGVILFRDGRPGRSDEEVGMENGPHFVAVNRQK
ncbi:hypothetical protein HDV00_011408 [Rhizophlyctis rosea]|nr:hypothetical protein HDV00_011408 [Rhizophlyctis rosea]